ncbi:citryl-CoA lyase [Advenella sp. FME57]|uniref:citrate synthase (unknown stereospecificity) n=1 Tax=Advenella kashmirensis TaxID=310575 RepID=A0A356LCA7_9BURK|nr:citryl-CoA lyase [Advenella sp. FME57]HBP28155.1 citryl-CoA lyase [Advenella kashmirensis]
MAKRKQLRTDISWSTEDTITIKGLDLCRDIMGKVSLGDMAFLELTDRLPNERESRVFNALAVILVEHGMTPSAIVTRMTICGAPEAMQAAVAAGLNGLGSVFVGSMENAACLLQTALPDPSATVDTSALARQIVAQQMRDGKSIPGIGHHIHKPVDPRAPRLFEIAEDNGFSGPYVALMNAVADEAGRQRGKSLPVNATGAIAAVASELKIPWDIVRGIGVMARAIGLVAHVLEELRDPMAREIKAMVEEQATAHHR